MTTENIVYSTSLGGSMNLFEETVKEKLHKERLEMEEFMFLEPLGNEEDDYFNQQHLDYDDICEEYEERKRASLAEEQEY